MNEVISQLHARRSVRAFTEEPVSPEDERAILEAACQAPTAGNQQLYSIIVVRDQARKDALAASCDHQDFIAAAPLVLVFCADVRRWWAAFCAEEGCDPREPGVGDLVLAIEDATIAAQNAVVAAESLGLGSCYIGDILERREDQRAILGLPRYVAPACMLVVGHPTERQLRRPKPRRFELGDVVMEDAYRDADARGAIAQKRAGTAESLAGFCERKWNSGFSREMTRSVSAWLGDFAYQQGEVPVQEGDWDGPAARVARLEAALEQVVAANRRLEAALAARELAAPAARDLSAYLESGEWLADYERDEAGELPCGLRRGVLSQDAAYDALSGFDGHGAGAHSVRQSG